MAPAQAAEDGGMSVAQVCSYADSHTLACTIHLSTLAHQQHDVRWQVESLMQRIPVVALVNAEDQPFFTSKEGGKGVAFFFLDPADALLEMRVMR